MLSGEGQVYSGMSTPPLITQAEQHFQVLDQPGTSPPTTCSSTPPSRRSTTPSARQAIYATTDFAPILQHIFGNPYPVVQGFTGPGGICYQQNVARLPGLRPDPGQAAGPAVGLDKVTITLGTILQPGRGARPPRR